MPLEGMRRPFHTFNVSFQTKKFYKGFGFIIFWVDNSWEGAGNLPKISYKPS